MSFDYHYQLDAIVERELLRDDVDLAAAVAALEADPMLVVRAADDWEGLAASEMAIGDEIALYFLTRVLAAYGDKIGVPVPALLIRNRDRSLPLVCAEADCDRLRLAAELRNPTVISRPTRTGAEILAVLDEQQTRLTADDLARHLSPSGGPARTPDQLSRVLAQMTSRGFLTHADDGYGLPSWD